MNRLRSSKISKLISIGFTTSLFVTGSHFLTTRVLSESTSHPSSGVSVSAYLSKNKPETYRFLQDSFKRVVDDAKKPEPNEIVNNLISLSSSNQTGKIKSRVVNGNTEFLMSTWTRIASSNENEWEGRIGKNYSFNYYVWVTASPQVQEFCQNCKGLGFDAPGNIMLNLRLQQYLGLKLESIKTHFVEMWVKQEDLMRPCVDQEINDSSCTQLPTKNSANQTDLISLKQSSEGYPWTGLGYTYDWGNPKKPHEGASEFVIKRGTPQKKVEVEIVSVTRTEDYCKNKFLMTSNFALP